MSRRQEPRPAPRRGPSASQRFEFVWAPVLYALATLWLYRSILDGSAGFGWDTIESYWGDLQFLANQIRAGEWPLWNPSDRGGYPFIADPQPGATYPLQWVFALFGSATDHGWWLIQIKVLVHHAIGAIAMHAFLRSRGLRPAAAMVGAMALLGSSPFLVHKASNILWPIVWLPLIWLATDKLLTRPNWRRGVLLAGALYLAGSAGSPPGFFYVLLAAVLYGGFRWAGAIHSSPPSERRQLALRQALALGIAGAVALSLLAITTLPGLELSTETTRATRSVGYALSLPMPISDSLLGMWAPALARPTIYVGIGATLLAIAALALAPRRDRAAPVFFFITAAFFVLLAFGDHVPILRWLVEHVPGFNLFRISNRYKLPFVPCFAVLAAFGAQAVIDSAKSWTRERITLVAVAIAGVVLSLVLASSLDGPPKPVRSSWAAPVIAALSAGLIIACALTARRASSILVATLALLVLADPAYTVFARSSILERQPSASNIDRVADLDGIKSIWRVYDEFLVGQRAGSRHGIRDFRGYPSGDPLDYRRYREVLGFASKHPQLLEAFNVRYLLHHRHPRSGFHSARIKTKVLGKHSHFSRLRSGVWRAAHPVPLAVWYPNVRQINRGKVLAALLEADTGEALPAFAVVEPGHHGFLSSELSGGGAPVRGTLVSRSANRIEIEISAPARGLVVLNEVYDRGWRVDVDGQPRTSLRANYLLRAVEVSAGTHRIVWRYRPSGLGLYVFLFAFGWCALLLAFALPQRRSRRATKKRSRATSRGSREHTSSSG